MNVGADRSWKPRPSPVTRPLKSANFWSVSVQSLSKAKARLDQASRIPSTRSGHLIGATIIDRMRSCLQSSASKRASVNVSWHNCTLPLARHSPEIPNSHRAGLQFEARSHRISPASGRPGRQAARTAAPVALKSNRCILDQAASRNTSRSPLCPVLGCSRMSPNMISPKVITQHGPCTFSN